MSLLKNLPPASRLPVASRLTGFGFFCACVLSLTALACSPNDSGEVSDTAAAAATPAASAPSADTTSSGVVPSAESANVAAGSVSEAPATPAEQPAAPVAAPKAAEQPAPVRKATTEAKPAAPKPAAPKAAVTETAAAQPVAPKEEAPKPAATETAEPRTDSLLVTAEEYDGWKFFHVYCYRCHGTDAVGSDIAPNLRHSVGPQGSVTHDVFIQTVTKGRPEKGMPSWETLLTSAQIEHLYSYVKARSEGRLLPGRPHTKK